VWPRAVRPRSLWSSFKIRQLTDVSRCNLQHDFLRKRHRAAQHGPGLPREQRRVTCAIRTSVAGLLGNR